MVCRSLVLVVLLLIAPSGAAQFHATTLLGPEPQEYEQLGWRVALEGRTLVSSARLHDDGLWNVGKLLVYRHGGDGWELDAQLTADEPLQNDFLGQSLALWRDTLVAGTLHAEGSFEFSGSVYVFERVAGAWQQQALISPPAPQAGLEFGTAVAVGRRALVVGAPGKHNPAYKSGRVYVYLKDGDDWTLTQVLGADDTPSWREFGGALDLDGDRLVVGGPLDPEVAPIAGAVYVYTQGADGSFAGQVKLTAPDGQEADGFGMSVATAGPWIAVGVPQDDPHDGSGFSTGSVHLFRLTDGRWVHHDKLLAPDVTADDFFGRSLAMDREHLVISAANPDGPLGSHLGAAYVYAMQPDGPAFLGKLTPPAALGDIDMGGALAVSRGRLALGAHLDDQSGVDAGASFVLELPDGPR